MGGSPPPVPDLSDMPEWYIAIGGKSQRPVSLTELTAMVRDGKVSPSSLAWKQGMAGWVRLWEVPELASVLAPPPLPPMAGKLDRAGVRMGTGPDALSRLGIAGRMTMMTLRLGWQRRHPALNRGRQLRRHPIVLLPSTKPSRAVTCQWVTFWMASSSSRSSFMAAH